MGYITLNGRTIRTGTLAEKLTLATAGAATQDGLANVWRAFWTYQIGQGQAISFKALNLPRYSTTWLLMDAPTTAMTAATLVRLVQYAPDGVTMKRILLSSTYGVLVTATGANREIMVTVDRDTVIPPGDILALEAFNATQTLDVSECAVSMGCTRHTFNTGL